MEPNPVDVSIDLSFLIPSSPCAAHQESSLSTERSERDKENVSDTVTANSQTVSVNESPVGDCCPSVPHQMSPTGDVLIQQMPSSNVVSETQICKPNHNNLCGLDQLSDSNSSHPAPPSSGTTQQDSNRVITRSLGTWTFNKRKRKRVYISLTGKKLCGPAAMRQCREDRKSSGHPAQAARAHLAEHVRLSCPNAASLSLVEWGLPPVTVSRYAAAGVYSLFPWQAQCLFCEDAEGGKQPLSGGNLIYTAPTSGGKTLVSELLMLRRLGAAMENAGAANGTILFVVPFISLAEFSNCSVTVTPQEKAAYFQEMWADLFIGVRTFHGEDDGATLTDDVDVAVCTIERANVLLNQLLDDGEQNRLLMVVVDELHLVSDSRRGFILEVLLSKIRYTVGPDVQLVAMSATLPSVEDLAVWLGASLFSTLFRPVNLQTRVCCGRQVYRVSDDGDQESKLVLDRTVDPATETDEDGFLSLCDETLRLGKSLMVFCSSKKRCEMCVERICELLERRVEEKERTLRIVINEKRVNMLDELRQTPVGLCSVLRRSVLQGVAYHHAGLTLDERKILEQGYRNGVISVLCTTSTLSAGVNLPAHRVIVRSPIMGNVNLSVAAFRQMCGRAGRMNLDTEGEAILMVSNTRQQRDLAVHLVSAPLDALKSSLNNASGGGIEKLLLEMVYCRKIQSPAEVDTFMKCTLLSVQRSSSEINVWVKNAMEFLLSQQFVVLSNDTSSETRSCTEYLRATPLGKATALSGIAPRDAVVVLASLTQARRSLILQSGFHAVFLVTPPSPSVEPCWSEYERMLDGFLTEYPDVQLVCDLLKVRRGDLCAFKRNPPKYGCTKPQTCFYRRLYSAILLFSLIQEMPLNKVCLSVNVQRGQLQQLQKDAAAFCGMVSNFCRNLNWNSLSCVLETYSGRLSFGVRPELLPLTRLGTEMPGFRARAFYRSGIQSPEDLLRTDPSVLCSILMDCLPYEDKDPILASTGNQRMGDGNMSTRKSGKEENCLRLVARILHSARKAVRDEVSALNRESVHSSSM